MQINVGKHYIQFPLKYIYIYIVIFLKEVYFHTGNERPCGDSSQLQKHQHEDME